ncbi:MAG: 4Fe-4S ferredoxin, partial [SAR324 cluster bacterium]|nr:4Fe-4S ferredoxin [SAR324 cluster bacterium]
FWQSPLLILHMLLHAVVGGSAALLLAGFLWEPIIPLIPLLKKILMGGLVVQVLSLSAELIVPHSTEDSHRTVIIITHGLFQSEFWVGVILAGSILPFLMLLWSTAPLMLALAGALVLIGIWYSIRIWVMAPQMIPLS